jgi:hypothetical protein
MFDKFTDYRCLPRGGDGCEDGGYFDANGNGHGHYWLEVSTEHESFIVDLTADQFGDAPVIVAPAEGNWRYRNGNQQLIDAHFHDIAMEIKPYMGLYAGTAEISVTPEFWRSAVCT